MTAPASNRLATLCGVLVIAAAVLAIYSPVLHGDWLWDDGTLILQNHIIHDPAGLAAIWRGPINGTEYLPLTSTVEWIEWHLFGTDTLGYHLVSLALHAASAVLVWQLLARLGLRAAWLGGLLFAIHPVAVESVAWISEQKNTVSLPPLLLAMIAWINFDRNSCRDYYFALGWFLIAMLAKPTGLMLPAIQLLYAWRRRGHISARDLLASAPFFVIAIAFGLLASMLAQTGTTPSPIVAGVAARLATVGWQMVFFLTKCVLPLHLLPLYPSRLIVSPTPVDALPWLFVAALLGLAWRQRVTWGGAVLFGLGFFLLNLAPALAFIYANATTMTWSLDHLVYLPLIGLVGLAVAGLDLARVRASGPQRLSLAITMALVCALFASGSFFYTTVFADQRALWTYDLTGNPNSATAHNNLGLFYLNNGQYPEAAEQYRAALRLKPDYAYAHNGLGNALAMQAQAKEAAAEYRAALALDPNYAEAHNGLANVLLVMKQIDEARTEAELSLKLKPNYVEAICTLGLIDAQQGKTADAIQHFETAQKLAPNNAQIQQELDYLRTH